MGSGVSTVTDEAGKISIEKVGEEKLINELKDVYQKNPEQMQRLWEQITSGSVPGVETDKSSANAAMAENSVAQSKATTKKEEASTEVKAIATTADEQSPTPTQSSTSILMNQSRVDIKIKDALTNEATEALAKLPDEVSTALKSQLETLIRDSKQSIVLNTSDGSCNIQYEDDGKIACSTILYGVHQGIFNALNELRKDPKGYAEKYLSPRLSNFEGNVFKRGDGVNQMTHEGAAAVQEAISVLSETPPITLFEKVPPGMSLAALDHVNDTGPKGLTGHDGSDGSKLSDRLDRYGSPKVTWGENIDYGNKDPFAIVSALLVDDGVPNRGHRSNLLNPEFVCVGIAVGPHKQYSDMCVMDYAGGWGVKKNILKEEVTEKFTGTITDKAFQILGSLPDGLDLKPDIDQALANGSNVELMYKPGEITLKIISGEGVSTRSAKWGVKSGGH